MALLLLILLAFCWGPAFFFTKIALSSFPVFLIINMRVFLAFLFLFTLLKIKGEKLSSESHLWKQFFIMSILSIVIPWSLLTYGQLYITSSLAGVVGSCIPISTVILAHFFLESERFSKETFLGILLGFLGIACIFIPSLSKNSGTKITSIFCLILATISSASSFVYARKHLMAANGLVAATYQILFAALFLVPFTILELQFTTFKIPSLSSISALLFLGLVSTALAFAVFYKLLAKTSATYVSSVSLLMPIVSMGLGIFFLKESVQMPIYLGTALIMLSLVLINPIVKHQLLSSFKSAKGWLRTHLRK